MVLEARAQACQMHNRKAGTSILFAAGLAAALSPARAAFADEPPPFALGPAPSNEVRPTGREVAPPRGRPDPAATPLVACSLREAVCVHAEAGAAPAAILWTLRWAERALVTYRALGLPAPLDDAGLGGSPAHDIYLLASERAPRRRPTSSREATASTARAPSRSCPRRLPRSRAASPPTPSPRGSRAPSCSASTPPSKTAPRR